MTRPGVIREITVPLPVTDTDGDQYGEQAKTVTDARLTLEYHEHDPTRRVLAVDTRDGWRYRFQRYADGEPWVQYDRRRPDGTTMTGRTGNLPASVEAYATAVDRVEIVPDPTDATTRAPAVHVPRDADVTLDGYRGQAAATDGGRDAQPTTTTRHPSNEPRQ